MFVFEENLRANLEDQSFPSANISPWATPGVLTSATAPGS